MALRCSKKISESNRATAYEARPIALSSYLELAIRHLQSVICIRLSAMRNHEHASPFTTNVSLHGYLS